MRIMMKSRIRERLRDERGIALPMVLTIFIVGVALITAFLVAIVGSANVSNITRTGIQSQAAADAGIAAAQVIGKRVAEKAKAAGVEKVAFDRAGFAYHGRVKALADSAREAGLQF